MQNYTRLVRLLAILLPGLLYVCSAAEPTQEQSTPRSVPASYQQAYTTNHYFLVRLSSVPSPAPMQKYFSLQLDVYDGNNPQQRLLDPQIQIAAGMTHGMKEGFAHEMPSLPRIELADGVTTVSGLFFTMAGDWTLRVTVREGGHEGTADFQLPCCAN